MTEQGIQLYRIVGSCAGQRHADARHLRVRHDAAERVRDGQGPSNAKVAVTKGILQILDERELRGVLAHELDHVANRDILVSAIAAAVGTSINYLATMAFWFGGDDMVGTPSCCWWPGSSPRSQPG